MKTCDQSQDSISNNVNEINKMDEKCLQITKQLEDLSKKIRKINKNIKL